MNSGSGTNRNRSTRFGYSLLEATSIGSTAHSRLKASRGEGVIHGVFDRAVNVLLTAGLVSVVLETVERGPLNITLRLPSGPQRMSSLGVRVGDRASAQGLTLKLGDRYGVAFGSAGIYSPSRIFTVPVLEGDEIAANAEAMRKTALLLGNRSGLGDILALLRPGAARVSTDGLNIFASAALPRIVRLERAFRSEEKDGLTDAVRGLIGLGPGLTPSSDDMLAGLVLLCVLYARNAGRAQRVTRLIAQAAAAEAHGRTTVLSEEYLTQAASGRGNEPVMRLCTALLTEGRESTERETRRVLTIGESSGTDTVLGIVLGTMFCIGASSGLTGRESR